MKKTTIALIVPLAVPLALMLSSTSGFASDEMEEIVVTADFRAASQLDTPVSVSIIDEDFIDSRAAQHFEDVIHSIPNLNFSGGTGRARFFQIRGIGERSQFVDPLNPSVGILIDGVDFSGIGSGATLFDVKQAEVLRGPQGTRYGANALAGLINIRTNDPTEDFYAGIRTSVGNYGTVAVGGVVSGPLGDQMLFRLAGENHKSDGYTENAFLGRDDVNARDETTLRGKLAFSAGDDHTTTVTVFHLDVDNGYDAFSLDNTRVTLSDEPGHDRQRTTAVSLDSQWQRETFDLEVLASGATSKSAYGYDEDWSFVGIHPFGYTSTDDYRRDRDTLSLEARLISRESSRILNGSTDWVFGFYSLDSDEDLARDYTFLPGPFSSRYAFTTLATFFQLDTHLTERMTLTSGLRFEQRDTSYIDSEGVAFEPRDSLWGGRVAIKWRFDDVMSYLSIARGYKAGGFNTDGSLDQDLREFDSEYLWELEAGIKGMALDGLMQFRAATFYDLRRDQQVKSSLVRPRPDGSTEFIDFVGNAAEGTNFGLELETNWFVSDNLLLIASVGLLETEFDEFINEVGDDLSGREQAQAPSWMFSLAANYTYGNWSASVSVDGKDDFFFSDRHSLRSTGSTLVNANVSYQGNNWAVRLWGRNLTDDDYTIRGFGSFGNDPRKNYVVEPYVQFGEPQIIGITFKFDIN